MNTTRRDYLASYAGYWAQLIVTEALFDRFCIVGSIILSWQYSVTRKYIGCMIHFRSVNNAADILQWVDGAL
jgi:hypothetical protein